MKVALVTPWPPQHTGIADYAYDLAQGICAQVELTVVTTAITPRPLAGVAIRKPEDVDAAFLNAHDVIYHQLGNNRVFHQFQVPIIPCVGGIVHLHDMVLHHLSTSAQ